MARVKVEFEFEPLDHEVDPDSPTGMTAKAYERLEGTLLEEFGASEIGAMRWDRGF